MLISKGDLVRPNKINLALPLWSLWRVIDTIGGLKLYPYSSDAAAVKHLVAGLRFKPEDFTRQTRNAVGEWVDAEREGVPAAAASNVANQADEPDEPSHETKAVAKAREAAEQAAVNADRLGGWLAKARAVENQRKAELRAARLEAQHKKELRKAEAEARAYEKSHALRVRLHADRLLALATLDLIGEVAWLNNGGAERPAPEGIAAHCDQLQPLARSYGYRIVKPSMVALVVKL